jgi:hypothetical protein
VLTKLYIDDNFVVNNAVSSIMLLGINNDKIKAKVQFDVKYLLLYKYVSVSFYDNR